MANRKVTLYWFCKTPLGWRRKAIVLGSNNRILHTYVLEKGIDGKQIKVSYPTGRYELCRYEGTKPVYIDAGTHPSEALALWRKESSLSVAKNEAVRAGAKVITDEKRVEIRRGANLYIQDCEYRRALEAMGQAKLVTEEFMLVCRKTYIDEIVKEDIYRFHRALRDRGCGDRTVANKHLRLKSFLRFAGFDTNSAALWPSAPKYSKALPEVYSPEQVTAILAAAGPYMRLVIELGLKLGLRDQEMAHAEWQDVDWTHSVYRVRSKPQMEFMVKDCEERDIPISSDLLSSLRQARVRHPETKLIVGTKKDTPNRKLLRTLKRLAKAAGLNCKQCDGCKGNLGECEQWYLHKLRATYATTLLRNGVDLRTVQAYMGHAQIATTATYLRPASTKEAQSKVDAIDWCGGLSKLEPEPATVTVN